MRKIEKVVCIVQNRERKGKTGLRYTFKNIKFLPDSFFSIYFYNYCRQEYIFGNTNNIMYINKKGVSYDLIDDWDIAIIDDDSAELIPEEIFKDNTGFMVHSYPDNIFNILLEKGAKIIKQGQHQTDERYGFSRLGRIFLAWQVNNTFDQQPYDEALDHLIEWFGNEKIEAALLFLHQWLNQEKIPNTEGLTNVGLNIKCINNTLLSKPSSEIRDCLLKQCFPSME